MKPDKRERGAPAGLSPERAALAARLATHREAIARASAVAAALERAEAEVRRCRIEADDATEALEGASAAAAEHLIASAGGHVLTEAPPPTMRAVRDRVADAEAAHQAARAARDAIQRQADKAASAPDFARYLAENAAREVIAAEARARAARLAAEVDAAMRDLAEKGGELDFLARAELFGRTSSGSPANPVVSGALYRLSGQGWADFSAERDAGRARWDTALAALLADATALLP